MPTRLRLLLAALAWSAGLAARGLDRPETSAACTGYAQSAARGLDGWRAAACWGWRCRLIGAAPAALQHARDGCGPAALWSVLAERRRGLTQDLLWSICRDPAGGTTLGRLAWAARRFGVGCRICWAAEPAALPSPAIVHLQRGHFVVLQRSERDCAWVFDPACGVVRVPWPVLTARSSGAALHLEPVSGGIAPLATHMEDS